MIILWKISVWYKNIYPIIPKSNNIINDREGSHK